MEKYNHIANPNDHVIRNITEHIHKSSKNPYEEEHSLLEKALEKIRDAETPEFIRNMY